MEKRVARKRWVVGSFFSVPWVIMSPPGVAEFEHRLRMHFISLGVMGVRLKFDVIGGTNCC